MMWPFGNETKDCDDPEHQRSGPNAARISVEKSSGSSQAAKWPPRSTSLKYARSGETVSTQLRGAGKTSPGKFVKPTGTATGGGAWPAVPAAAWARPVSQYHRAEEAPVPVSQYSVMLSTMLSRVRLPTGSPLMNAREIL